MAFSLFMPPWATEQIANTLSRLCSYHTKRNFNEKKQKILISLNAKYRKIMPIDNKKNYLNSWSLTLSKVTIDFLVQPS